MSSMTRRNFLKAVLSATFATLREGAYGDTPYEPPPKHSLFPPPGEAVYTGGEVKEINVKLRRFTIEPEVIRVKQGDFVRLQVEGVDIEHGFYIDGYNIGIEVGHIEMKTLEFVAYMAGAFKTRCTVTCGAMHPFMVGKFVVEPNNRFKLSLPLAFGFPFLAMAYYYLKGGKK